MNNKIWLIILISLFFTTSSGCHWFVPGSIKRQSNIVKLDVKTCLKEIKEIKQTENQSEREMYQKISDKALRTLTRLEDQVENIDNYTHGRPATRSNKE